MDPVISFVVYVTILRTMRMSEQSHKMTRVNAVYAIENEP